MAKQPKIPVRIIGMPKPAAHEHEAPVYPIAGDVTGVRDGARKFFLRFRRQHLVGIEDEDPFVAERKVLQRPVLFLRPRPIEIEIARPGRRVPARSRSSRRCSANRPRRFHRPSGPNARHRGRFAASFLIGTIKETGTCSRSAPMVVAKAQPSNARRKACVHGRNRKPEFLGRSGATFFSGRFSFEDRERIARHRPRNR